MTLSIFLFPMDIWSQWEGNYPSSQDHHLWTAFSFFFFSFFEAGVLCVAQACLKLTM